MAAQKYTQIYYDLKKKIEDGIYAEQNYLPSEYTLIEEYKCSRNTVRRAIRQLADNAYVQSIHGKGVVVIYHKTPKNEFSLGGIESLKEAARRNNRTYKTKVIHFADFVVDEYLNKKTGFAIGEELIYVQRVRYFDNVPEILDHNWFLKKIVKGLTPEIAEDSVYEYMEEQLGEVIVTTRRRLSVEPATEVDEKYLDLGENNCLAVITSQTYNKDGVMFEYTQSRHRPDRFVFYTQAQRTPR